MDAMRRILSVVDSYCHVLNGLNITERQRPPSIVVQFD